MDLPTQKPLVLDHSEPRALGSEGSPTEAAASRCTLQEHGKLICFSQVTEYSMVKTKNRLVWSGDETVGRGVQGRLEGWQSCSLPLHSKAGNSRLN